MKEHAVASHIRLDAAQLGIDLWRNNVGVLPDQNGRPVRYGLANESAALNKRVKSSDFIGITPVIITPQMIGHLIGVFTAIETKPSDWRMTPSDERALAQANFHDIVRWSGGYAGFARTVQEFRMIVRK
jgi:hypothetical protein